MGFAIFDRGNREHVWSTNIWHWHAIVAAIGSLDVLPDERVELLHTPFCGYGLDAEESRVVAAEIRARLLPILSETDEVTIEGRITDRPPDGGPLTEANWNDHYRTNRDVLIEFVDFLEQSEGFDVA